MLWVTAYADRLVVAVTLMGSRTIMADQLGPVTALGAGRPEIRIEHTAMGLVSPVTLRLQEDHPVREAIEALVGSR